MCRFSSAITFSVLAQLISLRNANESTRKESLTAYKCKGGERKTQGFQSSNLKCCI